MGLEVNWRKVPQKEKGAKSKQSTKKGKLENSGPELDNWMTGVPSGEKAGTWYRSEGLLNPPQWVKAEPDGGKKKKITAFQSLGNPQTLQTSREKSRRKTNCRDQEPDDCEPLNFNTSSSKDTISNLKFYTHSSHKLTG